MALLSLNLTDFRNIASLHFVPRMNGFNIIYGPNASGKTSLLEAIYYLNYGRSFRTTLHRRVIRHETDKFTLFGTRELNGQQIPVGLERNLQGDLRIRVNGNDVSSAVELAAISPVQLITAQGYNLLEGGPLYRRKFIDWGCFYLQPNFFEKWRQYGQILKQRNAALRAHLPKKQIDIWTDELVASAEQLAALRQAYLAILEPILIDFSHQLLGLENLTVRYAAGWNTTEDFSAVLEQSFAKDLAYGYTHMGPHRADLLLKINNHLAKDILSRGQQKLFICAMMLAQGAVLNNCLKKKSIYLIDDLPAELDSRSKANLMRLLAMQETQVFITAIEKEALERSTQEQCGMFHVEHGSFKSEQANNSFVSSESEA